MVLREMEDILVVPLPTFFQMSFDKATVPTDWRDALVCPVYKKDELYLPEN